MAGKYEKAITIKAAIDAINKRSFMLPAIQRKFVWSSHQVCMLFDSIMRGYPINTFMMWEIKDGDIKKDYKFYEFLKFYCQRFNEENPHVPITASSANFSAIIDGQQRLTSLYIGLCSTYAYKQPRVWWPNARDDSILPPRKLYLDLKQPKETEEDESLMHYNFKFMTDKQFSTSGENSTHHWFCMHNVLNLEHKENLTEVLRDLVKPELQNIGLAENEFAEDTLLKLYDVVRNQEVIHYFKETSQQIDHVLDVFIRTNSGGTKLDFADLLTSIAVAHWDGDFRQELEDLTKHIHQNIDMGFYIERDWILKTCLMLTEADVRFKIKNFKADQVHKIQEEWEDIKDCIKATFLFVRRIGINPQSLTSKNAVIPVCYYLYKKQFDGQKLYQSINNLAKAHDQRKSISQWFYMVLLKGVFGGQADSILASMREVLKSHIQEKDFPLGEIIERYKATNKDLRFDNEYIESMLDIQHGEGRCRALLHLLFPEMNATEIFHIDHLHPKSAFKVANLKEDEFILEDETLKTFFSDPAHWNTIANLHLLNDSQNRSKGDRSLKDWINDTNVNMNAQNLLVEELSLEFEDFKQFFNARRAILKKRLIDRVFMSNTINVELSDQDFDDEVVEEAVF